MIVGAKQRGGGVRGASAPLNFQIFSLLIYYIYHYALMTKEDTRSSCAQKVDSTAIGNHVGDPSNNDLKNKKKIL